MKSGSKILLSTFILSILIHAFFIFLHVINALSPQHNSTALSDYVAQLFIDAGEGYSKATCESVGSNNSNIYKEYTFLTY